MTTPHIGTARVDIVPFSKEHLSPRYVSWLNDPETVRYSDQRFRRHTLESCEAYWRSFAGTPHHFWAILLKPAGEHVGNITAYVDVHHQTADVGILVGERRTWGSGIGTEAFGTACRWLLQEGGLRKVTAGTLSCNRGMLGIMRKIGMMPDGTRRGQCLVEGEAVDMIHGALYRTEHS